MVYNMAYGDGINLTLTFGMIVTDGDKEVSLEYMKMEEEILWHQHPFYFQQV